MFHRFQQLQTIHLRFGSGQRHGSRRSRKSWFQSMGFPCNFSRMKYLKSKFRCYVWYFKISRMISLNICMALFSCYFLDNISFPTPFFCHQTTGHGVPHPVRASVRRQTSIQGPDLSGHRKFMGSWHIESRVWWWIFQTGIQKIIPTAHNSVVFMEIPLYYTLQ